MEWKVSNTGSTHWASSLLCFVSLQSRNRIWQYTGKKNHRNDKGSFWWQEYNEELADGKRESCQQRFSYSVWS